MSSPFNPENKVWQFLNKMSDIFVLSLLQIVCSIPILTIGAAQAGFYYAALKIFEGSDSGIGRDFFHGFQKGFKVCTLYWLLQLLVVAILVGNIYICLQSKMTVGWIALGINLILLFLVIIISNYAYPIAARYDFTLKKVIGDATVTAMTHLLHSLSILLIMGGVGYVCYKFPWFLVIGIPLVEYQIVRVAGWVFLQYERKDVI